MVSVLCGQSIATMHHAIVETHRSKSKQSLVPAATGRSVSKVIKDPARPDNTGDVAMVVVTYGSIREPVPFKLEDALSLCMIAAQ